MGEAFGPARQRLNGEGQSHQERRGGRTGAVDEGKSFDLADRVGLLGSFPHSLAISGRIGAHGHSWQEAPCGCLPLPEDCACEP